MVPDGRFENRAQGGRRLAQELLGFRGANPVVIGLARGGLPVALPVARALEAPLDVCVVGRRLPAAYDHAPRLDIGGRTVLLVDDGVATGATARAALRALRGSKPGRLVLAVPIAAVDALAALKTEADEIVCPFRKHFLPAIGIFYDDFVPLTDEHAAHLLAAARGRHANPA